MSSQYSDKIKAYFEDMDNYIKKAYSTAKLARQKGYDPSDDVEIPLVEDMAARVEGIISVVAPQIIGSGVKERIKELEKEYGVFDWRISLKIAHEIAQQRFCKFETVHEAMEIGIRAGFAYHTMGVVSSPLEGLVEIKLRKRKDGKEYFAVSYAGPIRSAGGTGASVSILITDYVRKIMGYSAYDPTEKEIKRISTELHDYHERVTNLQYLPSREEIEFLVRHIPVQIDGDASSKIEVSNYKDLERIDTNCIRGGVCLALGEGVAQKAPKLWKQLSKWGNDFGMEQWSFMKEFLEIQKKIKAKGVKDSKKSDAKISPDLTYIKDLVAGRPILGHPMRHGGFRLRYGRTRFSGYSSNAIHPATMHVLLDYLATGTQLKTERPGKATTLTTCEFIDGPTVKLIDGSVCYLSTVEEAKKIKNSIDEILYLGDMLINYGDFFNRAHPLVPPGYCPEWWIQELERCGNSSAISEKTGIPKECIQNLFDNPMLNFPSASFAWKLSETFSVPLHPYYTYYWSALSKDQFQEIIKHISIMKKEENKCIMPKNECLKRALELIGIPHLFVNKEFIVVEKEHAENLIRLSEYWEHLSRQDLEPLESLNAILPFPLRDRGGMFIGTRMGRPEKAKMRQLTGSPQVLFPVGEEGGRLRSFQEALTRGKITSQFPLYVCALCGSEGMLRVCECGNRTQRRWHCRFCGILEKEECQHGKAFPYSRRSIQIGELFQDTLKKLGMKVYPDMIKGIRGTSNREHTIEHLAKGILRAKHNIYVNKDGTTRYDMTQQPATHFLPCEIGTSISRLKELGYDKDIHGNPLTVSTQVIELLPQDIILPACANCPHEGSDEVLLRTAHFIDDLLKIFYKQDSFYGLKAKQDLVGHVVLILAPHTSAAIAARIIGFSKTQGLFANPIMHAATRRDCDGDEACVTLLLDALLNFSRSFLPANRGSTQDAPLVLTSRLTPSEVDDMVFDIDLAWKYPLEFYEACLNHKSPWEIASIDQLGKRLGTPGQYEGFGFTHPVENLNNTIYCSAYKILPSMDEKLEGQMEISRRIRAVDAGDVARLVIEKHFLKDTKGNLRKFSQQEFRCVNCNEKFRRPPLLGRCVKCNGRIIFTISEGSVIKYLGSTINLAEKFQISDYLKQTIELLQQRIESVFGKEKEKQEALGKWF